MEEFETWVVYIHLGLRGVFFLNAFVGTLLHFLALYCSKLPTSGIRRNHQQDCASLQLIYVHMTQRLFPSTTCSQKFNRLPEVVDI